MPRFRVESTARIDAPAERVYAIVADYRDGHPRILPQHYFRNLRVEQGGVGAGTVIRFEVCVFGTTRTARAVIAEPSPGRVLVETDIDRNLVTTFTVAPLADGSGCVVTISTELPVRKGVRGLVERQLTTRLLRKVYAEELALLAAVAAERAAADAGADTASRAPSVGDSPLHGRSG